jgi:hypothetical protein
MKAGIVCGIVLIAAAVLVWQQHQIQLAAREENRALRQEVEALSAENARLSNQVSVVSAPVAPTANSQEREVLRLRNEVGALKRLLAEAARAQPKIQPTQQPATGSAPEQPDPLKEMAISKLNLAKGWVLASMLYAQQHGGQFPPDFESAAPFVPEGVNAETNLTTAQFEITYKGAMNELTNPQSIIVIREKEPWQTSDGGWVKGYGFADGHSEIHKAVDGNFQPWEAQHMVGAGGQGQ